MKLRNGFLQNDFTTGESTETNRTMSKHASSYLFYLMIFIGATEINVISFAFVFCPMIGCSLGEIFEIRADKLK